MEREYIEWKIRMDGGDETRERERGSHNKERACFPIGCICPIDLILSKIFTPFKQAIKRFLSLSLSLQGQPVIVEVDQWQCKNRGERAFIGKEKLSCRGGWHSSVQSLSLSHSFFISLYRTQPHTYSGIRMRYC